jgi:hypothetical protein
VTHQPVPPGAGFLVVDCSFRPMFYAGKWIDFVIMINGYPTVTQWGVHTFTMPVGVHYVQVGTLTGRKRPTALRVAIHPGQPTAVYYCPPPTIFSTDSLLFQPHNRTDVDAKSLFPIAVMFGIYLLLVVLIVVLH